MRGFMRRAGHHLTGLAAGILCATGSPVESAIVVTMGWFGGVAPDMLEVPYGQGQRLLPHRRITHWLLFWLGGLLVLLYGDLSLNWLLRAALTGFFAGGLAHCLGDVVNPAGIPLVHPWKKHGLGWWPSGRYDAVIGFSALFLAVMHNPQGRSLVKWLLSVLR